MGLYEFEVVVDGDGAHGEGYVNVTVNPGNFSSDVPANCTGFSFQSCALFRESLEMSHKICISPVFLAF